MTTDHPLKFYVKRRDRGIQIYEYRRMPAAHPTSPAFARRLRQARQAMGLPQDKLGVLAGLDEGTASARISRYESGIHEPNSAFVEKLASVLKVPMAYFYASDDRLAALILSFEKLDANRRETLMAFARELTEGA